MGFAGLMEDRGSGTVLSFFGGMGLPLNFGLVEGGTKG